ncbi:MAG: hypothetical protein P8H37_04630, partial [Paracoccaceae bacterium]|nr:hypothetical protein [Paracoccaceae bacterium]
SLLFWIARGYDRGLPTCRKDKVVHFTARARGKLSANRIHNTESMAGQLSVSYSRITSSTVACAVTRGSH